MIKYLSIFQWLCGTILARLVKEIESINRILERIGSEDLRIGGKCIHNCICHVVEEGIETYLFHPSIKSIYQSMYMYIFTEVSISSLKQVAATKSQYVPTLNKVIPYLEVSTNQEYLVSRIKGKRY